MSRNRPRFTRGERGMEFRRGLALRHGARCFYCHTPFPDPAVATLDHYLPWCLSHRNDKYNLVLACESCNNAKADQLPWPLVWVLLAAYRTEQEGVTPGVTPPVTRGVTQVNPVTPPAKATTPDTTDMTTRVTTPVTTQVTGDMTGPVTGQVVTPPVTGMTGLGVAA